MNTSSIDLSGSIQHSLALKVLASPPAFTGTQRRSLRFRCRLLLWLAGLERSASSSRHNADFSRRQRSLRRCCLNFFTHGPNACRSLLRDDRFLCQHRACSVSSEEILHCASQLSYLKLWLDHAGVLRGLQVGVNLFPSCGGVHSCARSDTPDAPWHSMAAGSVSSTAHSRPPSSASLRLRSLLSRGSVPAFPGKACAHSFFVTSASRLAHADDQRDEFALGTVNATMALHGGQVPSAAHFLLSVIGHRSA